MTINPKFTPAKPPYSEYDRLRDQGPQIREFEHKRWRWYSMPEGFYWLPSLTRYEDGEIVGSWFKWGFSYKPFAAGMPTEEKK